jgi:hypothetical protein
MNKIIASASIAALGAASLQAAYAPGLSPTEKAKPWTISAILRGFYDDNPTASFHTAKQESWGVELSPSLGVNIALDQTLIGFNYTYDMRFFEARPKNDADHSHLVTLKVSHQLNERYKIEASDVFHYAQEPELQGGVVTTLRTQQNYIHNNGQIAFDAELTPILGLEAAYQNHYWDYDQTGDGSLSALLDRVEHMGSLTARWQAMPNTRGLLGYRFGVVNHTSKDSLNANPGIFGYTDPNVRDTTSHFVFVGVDQDVSSQLNAQVRIGGQFTDYPNVPSGQDDSTVSPWVDASATWTYNPGSYLQLGVKHERNQTDVAFTFSPTTVLDQESTAVYGVVNHRITPKLTGSLLGQYQHSTFKGGGVDGEVDQLGTLGVNFSYQLNVFVSAEAGYNYDRLDSDVAFRSFTRNRVYFGVRASY